MYSQILVNESDFFILNRRYLMSNKFTGNELAEGLIKASSEGAGGEVSRDGSNSDVAANVLSLANGDTEMISRRLGVSPEVAQQLANTVYNNSVNAIDDLDRSTNAKSLAAEFGGGLGAGILDLGSAVSTLSGFNGLAKKFSRGANNVRNFANSLKGEDYELYQRAKQLRELNYNHNSAIKEQEDIRNGMSSGLASLSRYGRDMIHSFNVSSNADIAEGIASGVGYLAPSLVGAAFTGGASTLAQLGAKGIAMGGAKLAAKNALAGGALNLGGKAAGLLASKLGTTAGKTIGAGALLGAGGAESQALETVDNLTDEQLQQTPYYKAHINEMLEKSNGDPVEALKLTREGLETEAMNDSALKGAIAEGGVSALLMGLNKVAGRVPGLKSLAVDGPVTAEQQMLENKAITKLLNKGTLTPEETKALKDLQARNGFSLAKTAKQYGNEFTEEALQEGSSTYATNTVEKENIDENKDVNEGVGESAMQGGIAGIGTKGGVTLSAPVKAILSNSAKTIANTLHNKAPEQNAQVSTPQQSSTQSVAQQVDSLTPEEKSEKVANLSTEVVNKVNTLQDTINSENSSEEDKAKATEELDNLKTTFAPILATDEEKQKVIGIINQNNTDGSKDATVDSVNNSKTKKELITTLGNILNEQKAALQTAEDSNTSNDEINQLKDSMKNTAQEIINLHNASHYTEPEDTDNQDENKSKNLQLNDYLVNSSLEDTVADENSVVNNAYKLVGRDIIKGKDLNVNPSAEKSLDINSKIINTRHIAANDNEYANEDIQAARDIHNSINTMLGTLKVWNFAENLKVDGDNKRIIKDIDSSKQNENILDVYENKIKSLKNARESGRLILSRKDASKLKAIDKLIDLKLDLRDRITNPNFELTDSEAEALKSGQTSLNEFLEAKFADEYKVANTALKAYKYSAQNNEQGYNEAISEIKDIISKNGKIASELIEARNLAHRDANNPNLQETSESAHAGIPTPHSGSWTGSTQQKADGTRFYQDSPASLNALHTALNNYTKAIETYNEISSYTNHLPTNRIQAKDAFESGKEPVIAPPDLYNKNHLAVSNSFLKAFGLTRNTGSENDEEYSKRFNSVMSVVPDSIKRKWAKINQNAYTSLEDSYKSKNGVEETDKALARKREALGKLSSNLGKIVNTLTNKNVNLSNSDLSEDTLSKDFEAIKAILIGMDSYGFKPKSATDESFATGIHLKNLMGKLNTIPKGTNKAVDNFTQWYSEYSKGNNEGGITNPEETIKYIDDNFAEDNTKVADLFKSKDSQQFLKKGISNSASLTSTSNVASDTTAASIRDVIFGSSPDVLNTTKSALPDVDVGFVKPERDVNVENAAVKDINKKFTEKSRGSEYDAKNTNRKKNILSKVFDKLGNKDTHLFDKHTPNPKRASNIFRHFGNLICAPELERETSALATFWNNFDIKGDKTLLNRLFELIKDSDIRTPINYSDIQSTIDSLIEKSDFSISEKEFVKQFFSEQQGQYQNIYKSIVNDVNNIIAELAKNSDSLENVLSWDDKRAYIPLIAKDGSGNLVPNPAMIAGLTMATMASYVRFINNVPADPFLGDKDWDLVSPKDKQSIEQDIQDSMLTDPITNEINYLFRDIMHISENDNADGAATALSGLGGIGLKALSADDSTSGAGIVKLVRVKTPNAFINGTNESVTRVKFFKQNSSLIEKDGTNVIYSDYQADLISKVFSSKPNEDFIIGDEACAEFLKKDGTLIDKFKKILHTFVGISDKEAEAIQNKFKESFVPDMNMYKTIEKWGPDATACFLLGISNKKDLANMSTDLRASMLSAYSQYMQSFQDMARVKRIRLGILEKIASNPKSNVVNGVTIDENFVTRFRNNDVTSEELQKLKGVLGQHFLHQMTRVDRFNAIGHSAVGDKIKRLYETNNESPLLIDGKDETSYRIFTRALSQAFGNDIWKEEVQDSVDRIDGMISSIKKKMQSNPEFAEKVQKFVNNEATTEGITDVFSAMKAIDDNGNHEVSYGEPVAVQGVKELLQYVVNGAVNSNLYIEFDGKSCGPATQYARYGSEISLHDLEVAWRSGNFFGYPADLRQLKRDIADLEAKTDRTEAEDKQLNKLKDIVANDGYMIMAKESVKYCQKVKERAFAEGSDTPSAKAFNALDYVMKHTVLRMGTMEVKASIPLTEKLNKGFRALAKLIGTPMVYGAGAVAEATTIAQGILRGIDYRFYKTVKYLEANGLANNSATANNFLDAFANANDMSIEDVKDYFNEILTLTSATTDVSGKTLDDAIIHMSSVSSGNTLIKMIMDKSENNVSAGQKFMWSTDGGAPAEVSLATVARAITWSSSDNLAVQSAVQTFITEPMNIGANKAFPPSAKETVNAQTALSGAMGMLNQFVVANVVNVMTNNNGGHFNATMEKQMFENPAIQKILKSTSLPHSDGDTRFYNYKFGHDANTFTTSMQNTSVVHVKINGQDYTISTKPTVMKAESMGVTSQPGGTQGSGDGDIMARVVNKLYSLTEKLKNKYGKDGKQTFIGSMFDGINVFLGSLRNGKPVDAIGEALSESLKQNVSVQTLEGINEMIQLFNEAPELLISSTIGLAADSNRNIALGFGYKIAEAIESLSEDNLKARNAAVAYRNRLSEANSLEDRAEAIISLLNSFAKLVETKAKRHEAKIAVFFGTPEAKNGVVDFLHPDTITRQGNALPSSLQNFDTMEFGHSTTHENTKRAMDDAKAPLSLSHTFFINEDGKLRVDTRKAVKKMKNVTPLVTRDEFIKSTTPEMIAEYCENRQEVLLASMADVLDKNIKANCLNFPEFKDKGISQKKLEDKLLAENITVADFKNYLNSLTTGIKVAFNSSGKKQDAKGFTQKLHELGNIARQIYFSATSGTRDIIDSAKVVSFDFTGYASKGEVEQIQYIMHVLKCDEETAKKYQNMLSKIKDFSNIKGLHLGVDAVLVTSKTMDDLQSTDAQKRADAIENITEIVNHEVSHMAMLDAIETAYTFGRKSEDELISELKMTKYGFDTANARIEAGKILALRQLNDQVEIAAEHIRIAYFKVLINTFNELCKDKALGRAQDSIKDDTPVGEAFKKFGEKLLKKVSENIIKGNRKDALNELSDLYKDLANLSEEGKISFRKLFNDKLAETFKNTFNTELTQELRDGFEEISLVSTSGNHTATVQETLTWFLNQKNFYDLVYRKGQKITKLADNSFTGYSIDYDWVKKLFGTRISNLLGNIHRGLMEFFRVLRQKCGLNPAIGDADMFQLLVTASQANLSNNFFTTPKGGITIGNTSINAMTGSNTSPKKHNVKDLDSFINTYPDSFNKAMNGIQMVNTALDNLNRRGLTPFTENQRAEFDYTLHSLLIGLGSGLPNTFKFSYLMDKGLKENRDKLSKDEVDYITNLEKEISDPLTRSFAVTALVAAKPQMLDKLNTKGITPPKVEADLNIEQPLADMINTMAGEVNTLSDPDVDNLTLKQAVENYKKDSWNDFNSLNFKVSPLKIGGRVKSNPVNNLFNKLDRGTSNLIRKSARAFESVGGKNKVSQTIRKVGSAVDSMYTTSEYERLSGEDFYDNLERWADTNLDQNNFLQNFIKQQIREYTNHTRGTNSYHNVKKISKNKVQQKAEALRSRTKIQLKKHCKDCKNWKAANRLFAMGSFFKAKLTRDDLNKLLQNPNEIQKEIYEYPVPVEVSNAITRLVTFIQTGTCKEPENLIRNTYAISQLYNESFDVVNRLYTLYTLEYLRQKRPDDFKDLKDFIVKDTKGEQLGYINNLLSNLYRTDLRKIANAPIIPGQHNHAFNFIEGHTPTVQEHQMIPTRDLDLITKLKQEGWKEQKISNNGVHYMVQDIVVQSFHSGALQVVNNTAMGIDIDSGFANNTIPYKDGMTSNKDEIVVPCYYHNAKKMHYEVIPVQPVEEKDLDSVIGDWMARYEIENNVDSANDMCMAELRKLYDKDPTSKRNINLSKLVDENGKINEVEFKKANLSKYQRKAIERLFNCPRILPFIEKYFPDGLIVRRDLIDDALGMESTSIVDIYTGNNNLPKIVNDSFKMFCNVFGGERGAMRLEAELRAITKVAKNSQVIKSVVVPAANFTANVIQMWMTGIPLNIIAKGYITKAKECNRFIALTREYADLQLESLNGKDVGTRMDKIIEEIQHMSIAPVINLGEFSTIQDDADGDLTDTGSYFIKAINKIKQTKDKFGNSAEALDELAVTERTLLYKCLERTTQYGDFIAKSICYDYWKHKYNENEAIFRVTSEFVDYDFMPSRCREWLEKIGWGWYWNYKLRMSKVMMRMVRDNPFRSLMFLTLPPTLFGIDLDTPFKDSALGRLLGMGPSLMSSFGFSHLFGLKNFIPVAGMF